MIAVARLLILSLALISSLSSVAAFAGDLQCTPIANSEGCLEFVAGVSGTNNPADLSIISQACKGNFGGECVKFISERSGVHFLNQL